MKNLLIIFILFSLFDYCGNSNKINNSIDSKNISKDIEINKLNERVSILRDSIKYLNSTISYKNYSNARKIEKTKYYISICDKKSSNKKYFFGWIKRTMSDK